MQNSYIVINASAGSGKTYALVQRLLMICLQNKNQEKSIQHILALTFTNKAANEMKERILSWLKHFASKEYEQNTDLKNLQEELAKKGAEISLEELHQRSKKLLDFILHHYSLLNIGTIDKFNAKLVRSFSQELGLTKNFNLEIQPEPFLIEAVDQMLSKIGQENEITNTFINFVNDQLENNERINLNKTLFDTAKEFVSDIHYEPLRKNENFDDKNYTSASRKYKEEIKLLQKKSVVIAENCLQIINEKGLDSKDFSGGNTNGIAKFFTEYLKFANQQRAFFPFPKNESTAQEVFLKGSSSQSKNRENDIFEILDFLMEKRLEIIQNYINSIKKEKILKALLPLKINKDLQNELTKIQEENDVVLLSQFNVLINENHREEPTSFIYEKIGTRFQHYFFDEFQDTSALQWSNFVPLRDHSVSTDRTSFTLVGDPKQSIYRFRGGESQIMMDIINHKEITPKEAEVIVLKENWRSAQNIVEFNNQLYEFLSKKMRPEHQKVFGADAQQIAKSQKEGRVRITLLENQIKADFYRNSAEKMRSDIQDCLDLGFEFSDITLLCRGNKDIFNYAQKLGALKVNYKGKLTHLKTISESGLTLELSHTLNAVMLFLNWDANPKNMHFLVMMMYHLNELGRVKMQDFSLEIMEIIENHDPKKITAFLEDKYQLRLYETQFPRLNVYNFVEFYLREFTVNEKETDFILNFLEILYGFTQNSGATVKDFIQFWEEEASKKSIQASENVDAIQLMTIHKAKGLEFPIVLFPMINTNNDAEFRDWFSTDTQFGLHSVNIDSFSSGLEEYDPEIKQFNEDHTYENYIDRICIQYVATTRPVEQLFLYIERPAVDSKTGEEKEGKIEIYEFLKESNLPLAESFDFVAIEDEKSLEKQTKTIPKSYQTQSITHFNKKKDHPNFIKIATPSKSYQNRNEKVRKGILMHEILAKVTTEKDLNRVLESYVLKGTLEVKESDVIRKTLLEILKKYARYFDENNIVLNEKDLMISQNDTTEIYRPDRLIQTEEGYFIIDFKTGEKSEKHEKQIQNYSRVLEKLGKKVLGTELIYLQVSGNFD